MAVPKKRMSRTRKNLRRGQWKLEIREQALKALSLGYSRPNSNGKQNIVDLAENGSNNNK